MFHVVVDGKLLGKTLSTHQTIRKPNLQTSKEPLHA